MAAYVFTPTPVTGGATVRFDTASGSTTPATIYPLDYAQPIPGALVRAHTFSGNLPQIESDSAVLYQKTLDYRGTTVTATATLTGTLQATGAPSGTVADISTALSGTYARTQNWANLTDSPAYIAHRGGANLLPENTLEAYRNAIACGLKVLELDCHLLTDGSLGVMHDATVDRTTSSTGNTADHNAMSWSRLSIDASSWFGTGYPNLTPPTLEQVLTEFGDKVLMVIEAKNGQACANAIVAMVQRMGLTNSVMLESFTLSELAVGTAAGMKTIYINDVVSASTAVAAGVTHIGCSTSVTAPTITAWKAAGLTVWAYTVDRHADRDNMFANGATGFISNDPLYIQASVATAPHRVTTAPFARGVFYHGQISTVGGLYGDTNRGIFTGGRWGWGSTSTGSTNYTELLGAFCPAPSTSYTLTVPITYDAVGGDTSRWVGIAFSFTDDVVWNNGTTATGNGYHAILRVTGSLELFKVTAGSPTSLATGATAVITDGTSTTVTIVVTGSNITVTRTGYTAITSTDTTYRGRYFHLSKNGTGVQASYGAATLA